MDVLGRSCEGGKVQLRKLGEVLELSGVEERRGVIVGKTKECQS